MKNSIKLSALLLLLSTGLFAATPAKAATADDGIPTITVQALRNAVGFGVSILTDAKATVIITDNENHVLLLDKLPKKSVVQKAYNLSELDNGDYAVTIKSNDQTVTKQLRVYDEYGQKAYVFLQ
ncbi:hypothetical protein FFF34_011095 [Inquilinus sp. KBS0705]|nr:hypothetical protein FFF34_011095 [Inquilinus sp. KBS0705]